MKIILVVLASLLWALGGTEGCEKSLRRIVYPLITAIYCLCLYKATLESISLILAYFLLKFGASSIGYGYPSPDDPEPSFLGKLCVKIFGYTKTANIAIRGICGFLYGLASVPLIILADKAILIPIAIIFTTIGTAYFGAIHTKLFHIKILGKTLEGSELLIGMINEIADITGVR